MRTALLAVAAGWLGASLQAAPNFVVVLGEGHGWSSTSVQMDDRVPQSKSVTVRTPNLERLADGGMRFADFYAASPRCTPSRAALLTGKSPAQLHMTFVGEGPKGSRGDASRRILPPESSTELPAGETTIAELLRRVGYATAHFGKWHVGRVSPGVHGFDESDGPTNNGGPDNVEEPHPKQLFGMTERGIDFMTRQVKAGRTFYLQLSHYASRAGGPAADADLDRAFGLVLQALDDLGIATNTYVIFTTDHGSPGRNPPLAGGKGTVSEGGLRVPFILRGPGVQPGACSHVRATHVDILPTLADLAQVPGPLPRGVEGGSLVPVLTHAGVGAVTRPREEFVFHFPHYDKDPAGPASALLLGDFKLIRLYESGALRLFNIAEDPGERHDLACENPGKAKELDQRLGDYLAAMKAPLPTSAADEGFVFTITADSHLDDHTDLMLYQRVLSNAAADRPVFHIDLGDTFMSEKHTNREAAARQYADQRRYFDRLGVPVHLVQGNHDGESGRYLDGTTNSLAAWSRALRQRYFPEPLAGADRNYYAWEQGPALFVVLDPFWYTPRPRRGDDNWQRTLGDAQYQWLQRTLEGSRAPFKFVFIHHLVGGLDTQGRGGVEAAPFYEWGGKNPDGADVFGEKRPGWAMPIHALLVRHHVSIVFHGHDHLYAKQDLDGIVYQEVPQPGDPRGSTRSASEYGYTNGVLLGSPGHLRVSVSPRQAKVEFIRPDQSCAHAYLLPAP